MRSTPRTGVRAKIPAAIEAALWALSNGRCYFPDCAAAVIVPTRPGVYKKNAQIAHIYGVKPGAPRFRPNVPDRDKFTNLVLLCLPHHSEVDDKTDGERLYPPETLLQWKQRNEGGHARALGALGAVTEERLEALLVAVFTPPLDRLEAIARQLEQTGTVSREMVLELKTIIDAMDRSNDTARAARQLAWAAETLGSNAFRDTAKKLAHAAEILPGVARQMTRNIEY